MMLLFTFAVTAFVISICILIGWLLSLDTNHAINPDGTEYFDD